MRHIEGHSRHQSSLLPDTLDDYVAPDDPVRVIDAFVDSLDLKELGFLKAQAKDTGRKPYHPGDLLKLYIYGYLNQVRSSRRLEKECHRNLELLWLLKRLAPDFKTIADFRKDNGTSVQGACRSFIQFCRQQQLLTGRLVAIDGSKFKAAASRDKAWTRKQVRAQRKRLDKLIDGYLDRLDRMDSEESEVDLERSRVEGALERLQAEGAELDELETRMEESGHNQYCSTEPQAKLMRGRDGFAPSYNVQSAVDAETGLIIHHEVTEEGNDLRQLQPMAEASKVALEMESLEVVADAGYSNGEQLANCEEQGMIATVPSHRGINNQGQFYQKEDFRYDPERNSYWCPAGKELPYKTRSSEGKMYLYSRKGCGDCAFQPKCTKSQQRWVTRHFYEDAYARSEARLKANPGLMSIRMSTAERPFAALKQGMGLRRFVCWGKKAVESEMGIGVLSYNLNRMMNEMGVTNLLAVLR